jgi:hypothetical protein
MEKKDNSTFNEELYSYVKKLDSQNNEKLNILINAATLIKWYSSEVINNNIQKLNLISQNDETSAKIQYDIEKEKDEKGKKKYTNATQRGVELKSRLKDNTEYNLNEEKINSIELTNKNYNIEIDFLKNILKIFNYNNF